MKIGIYLFNLFIQVYQHHWSHNAEKNKWPNANCQHDINLPYVSLQWCTERVKHSSPTGLPLQDQGLLLSTLPNFNPSSMDKWLHPLQSVE